MKKKTVKGDIKTDERYFIRKNYIFGGEKNDIRNLFVYC